MAAQPIPEGYHHVTPYLIVSDGNAAIEFYKKAFGAVEVFRLPGPEGKVMHAEIKIGDSMIMLANEVPEMNFHGPTALGGSPVGIFLYVEDSEALFKQAVDAGATELRPLQDQFYGDRSGTVVDPFGHNWTLSTHIEDVPHDELAKRMEQSMGVSEAERQRGCHAFICQVPNPAKANVSYAQVFV